MPPRRTCPNASVSPDTSVMSPPSRGIAPSATTMIGAYWVSKRFWTRSQTCSMSNGCSGIRTTLAPPDMPAVQRDPAGVPAHHLDDEHPVVRLGGGVQPVDRLARDVDRGVEAEGEVGAGEVVVDRLGYADHVDAEVGELGRDAEGVLAADRDQRVHAVAGEVVLDPLDAALDLERVGPAGAEDGAAARQDAAHLRHAELHGQALERALPAVAVADEVEAVHADALADHRPDHRVESGTVAASGEHSDPHADS